MTHIIRTTCPWPRRWVSTLALSSSLMLAAPVWAEPESMDLDELEITLEIFEDSAELEAFELRLEDDVFEERGERNERDERMERFEEEVASAREDDASRDQGVSNRDVLVAEEPADELERDIAREHENERLEEIASFDSADELDELDLAEEREEEAASAEDMTEELIEEELVDEELVDEELVEEEAIEETDELVQAEPPMEEANDEQLG